ncbi:MAG: type II CRISPR RNA-guided endonuclease Cas9 [Chitinophagales bacterium]
MGNSKKILGLDLGSTSIGWALVNEDLKDKTNSEIIKLGVRVNPLTVDEQTDFEKGKPLSTNADRTLKRGARRNLQRFKLRRENLIEILIKNKIISKDTVLTEVGKCTTFQTLTLRGNSATEKIELEEFARVLLSINKKRGYKSSRKAKNEEEGSLIDGMSVAKELYDNNMSVGQFVYEKLKNGEKYIPDFYRSDLQNEFDEIWTFQKKFYPDILSDKLYKELQNKNKTQTWAICKEPFNIVGIKRSTKGSELKKENYKWRSDGLSNQLDLESLAIVFQEINNNLNKSSGYLGAISDRSKELYFNKETVGQNLCNQILKNPHSRLKNQVFYRQDYLDEFETIWETQAKFHKELTKELKEEIRDVIIFYQRRLKSQKHLISECEFEKHHKTIPKSAPLFQAFKIWQVINNLEFESKADKVKTKLNEDEKVLLFNELNLRGNLSAKEVMNLLRFKAKNWTVNFKTIEGNRTNESLYNVYQQIVENEGFAIDWVKLSATEIKEELQVIFNEIGINIDILNFDYNKDDKQASFQLWHLLYSAEDDAGKISEDDKIVYGNTNVSLKKNLEKKYGFKPEYGNMLANISFQQDYGSLSSRAIKKIMPFLEAGHEYSEASQFAGYNHSHSLTAEEAAKRPLKNKLDLVKKNSLRNPVVEKILNQMVNVVNEVIDTYGKPDEIRIELARNLKQSSGEREAETKRINDSKKRHEGIRKTLQKEPFFVKNPTRNDIIRYKLYEELAANNYNTIYTDQYIRREKLFSKEIDIEHIIPKAKLFDDSFSNKTLAFRKVNLDKEDRTAFDYISKKNKDEIEKYEGRVNSLFQKGIISKAKFTNY